MDRLLTVIFCGILTLFLYVAVLGLIAADLWAGVRKAKQRGEYRTSEGYKRTITKTGKYFNMLIGLTILDAGQIAIIFFLHYFYNFDIPMLPIFTIIGTGYIGFVEIKSIREPANMKELKEQQDFKRLAVSIARDHQHPEEVLQDIMEALNENEEQKKQKENDTK